MNEPIPLSEKLYLLGINPKKGGIISAARTAMDYAILGGLIWEMYLAGNIRFENRRVEIVNQKSENKLHLFLLEKMGNQKRNLKVGRWINKSYFSLKYIRRQLQQNLMSKRLIQMDDRHFLFFRWKSPVIINRQAVYHLVDEIDSIVFNGTASEDELLMILLIQQAGLMRRIFQSGERRNEAKKRIKNIETTNQSSIAVSNAIKLVKAVKTSIAAAHAARNSVV